MKLKITGNTKELQHKIDSFSLNLKTELINKRTRNRRMIIVFSLLCFFIVNVIVGAFFRNDFFFVTSFCICVFLFWVISRYPETFILKSDESIEFEVNEKTRWYFGDRMRTLNLFYEGKLLSARIIDYGSSLTIELTYTTDNGMVCSYRTNTIVNKTSNTEYQGVFQVDLETGYSTLYYDDVLSPGQSLEIING